MDRLFGVGGPEVAAPVGDLLAGHDGALYRYMKEKVLEIAAGARAETAFDVPVEALGLEQTSWTAKELGVPCVDLNERQKAVGIDWHTDSLDGGDHLNISGAQKTTAYLMQYLKRDLGIRFGERAGKISVSCWNDLASEYQKIAKKELKRIRGVKPAKA